MSESSTKHESLKGDGVANQAFEPDELDAGVGKEYDGRTSEEAGSKSLKANPDTDTDIDLKHKTVKTSLSRLNGEHGNDCKAEEAETSLKQSTDIRERGSCQTNNDNVNNLPRNDDDNTSGENISSFGKGDVDTTLRVTEHPIVREDECDGVEESENALKDDHDNTFQGQNNGSVPSQPVTKTSAESCQHANETLPDSVTETTKNNTLWNPKEVLDGRQSRKDDVEANGALDSAHKDKSANGLQRCLASLKKWVTGPNFLVYLSHFLSAWGDRMWSFGVGVFLVSIASENLQLPAIYGLSSGLTIFFLGALVGDWVDSTARLRAAQASLILQNVFVVVCAAGVYAYLHFQTDIEEGPTRLWLVPLSHGAIIFVAILSNLASLARMIAVERDWIVEICGKDKDLLAKMTASLRRIDQGTLILAPIATGQIMTYAGLRNGAVFIAGWNVMSVFVEYFLIWKVYETVPALRARKGLTRTEVAATVNMDAEGDQEAREGEEEMTDLRKINETDGETADASGSSQLAIEPGGDSAENTDDQSPGTPDSANDQEEALDSDAENKKQATANTVQKGKCRCSCERVFSRFITLYRGWRTYMRYSVALAGLALACLYMTVLGFDNITVAYAMTQGVSESVLGILMGVSAVFGILGTFAYPWLRRKLGIVRTGIFALSAQVTCLVLCVVSVWMPGSPFDPLYLSRSDVAVAVNCGNETEKPLSVDSVASNTSYTVSTPVIAVATEGNSNSHCDPVGSDGPHSFISVGMLMGGIVLARFGLWIADLTITQLFLEEVKETERGIVNGVQSSLNKLMDVLKFVLVVAVPDTETFGFLIIVSFAFICLGWLLYAIFLRRARGHFFHFQKCLNSNGANRPTAQMQAEAA